jgi:hypothetical protein
LGDLSTKSIEPPPHPTLLNGLGLKRKEGHTKGEKGQQQQPPTGLGDLSAKSTESSTSSSTLRSISLISSAVASPFLSM